MISVSRIFFRSRLGHGSDLIILGIVLLPIPSILIAIINPMIPASTELSTSSEVVWTKILTLLRDQGQEISIASYAFIAAGIIISTVGFLAKRLWEDSISIIFKNGFENIAGAISDNLIPLKDTIEAHKIDDFLNAISPVEALRILPEIQARSYGEHSLRQQSFLKHLHDNYHSYCQATHAYRHDLDRIIDINKKDTNFSRFIETTSYYISINNPNGGESSEASSYPYTFFSKANVGKLASKEELFEHSLVVKRNRTDTLFDLEKYLHLIQDISNIHFDHSDNNLEVKISYREPFLEYSVKFMIELTNNPIFVETVEKSILSNEENYLLWSTKIPIYKGRIVLNIPHEWKIEDIKSGTGNWIKLDSHAHLPHKHTARIDGWIMPGIVYFIKWADRTT